MKLKKSIPACFMLELTHDPGGHLPSTTLLQRWQRGIAAFAAAMALAACGGGGDSSDAPAAVAPPVANKFSAVGSYPLTDCVKDNRTGLIWEGKPASGLRASTNTYTNYDNTAELQFWNGSARVTPTQSDIDAATNAMGYMNAVNASALCGFANWRLPTRDELQSLTLAGVSPSIDSTWFPNTLASFYWTSTPFAGDASNAWGVNFVNGLVGFNLRNQNRLVRLVR